MLSTDVGSWRRLILRLEDCAYLRGAGAGIAGGSARKKRSSRTIARSKKRHARRIDFTIDAIFGTPGRVGDCFWLYLILLPFPKFKPQWYCDITDHWLLWRPMVPNDFRRPPSLLETRMMNSGCRRVPKPPPDSKASEKLATEYMYPSDACVAENMGPKD
jgi:hypothetical protein